MRVLRVLTTIAIVLLATASQSQTVITYNNHSPQIGQTDVIKGLFGDLNPIEIDPGPAGANVTWNFAEFIGTEETTNSFIDPAQTPFADSIAGTSVNIATEFIDEDGAGYAFMSSTQQNLTLKSYGFIATGEPPIYNTYDPAPEVMVYPFAYGDTYDTYGELEMSFEGFVNLTKTWATATADAYGTLTNPTGTYNNVLRIKTVTIDSTFTYFNGQLFMADGYESIDYAWYSSTHRYMIQNIWGDLIEGEFEAWGVDYLIEESASVENPEYSVLKIYPNPAAEVLFIENGQGRYILTDLLGREVLEVNVDPSGSNYEMNVSQLPEGVYILQEIKDNQAISSQKVMIKR